MMQVADIVAQLYNDRRVVELISRQQPADLQQDLLHHCILELYRCEEATPGKLLHLHQAGELFAFFVGMVRRQNWSDKSTFYTRYKRTFESIEDHPHVYATPDLSTVSDADADKAFGTAFMDYFYNKYPNRRNKKIKRVPVQAAMF